MKKMPMPFLAWAIFYFAIYRLKCLYFQDFRFKLQFLLEKIKVIIKVYYILFRERESNMKTKKFGKSLQRVMSLVLCAALMLSALIMGEAVKVGAAAAYWTTGADTTFEGSGTEADPYRIYTADEFYGMIRISGKVNGTPAYFKLMNDLYFNNVMDGTPVTSIQNPRNWYTDALKDSSFLFAGHFDGDFHTVYGLYCNPTSTTYGQVGLFPNIATGSTIKNVSLSNSYLKIRAYVGGIAGSVTGGGTTPAVISRCTVDDTVTLEANECSAGGIVGRFTDACTIEDCASFATLIAAKGYKVSS